VGASLLTLINDILDLSKIEAGQFELERVGFCLEEVVDEAMELIGAKARARQIDLLCRFSEGVPVYVLGDPTRLRQVLINLLGNALKFTDSGEIVLTVRPAGSGSAGDVEFLVSDTGIGIPREKLETIFQDFTQADSSTTRKYGGTGLGLGISRRLVEKMGGSLRVVSEVGRGSTFYFRLNLEVPAGRIVASAAAVEDLLGRRVLVIDDNATNQLILRDTLRAWGMEAVAFADPDAALDALERSLQAGRRYSLAILDSVTPRAEDISVAAELHHVAPDLPIVLLSSEARLDHASSRREAGVTCYGIKPVRRADLLRMICEALQASSASVGELGSPKRPRAGQ
jgi:CheY-like chemotaxis protein